ncbi:MAG: lyase family protein [Candidatus Eremiobacteraeota bacterium]|nr:lyase family protein [Candidatus Eremiobacteraeota bacterium]
MKLWDKGTPLHSLVESFTVGDDYLLDRELLPYDCRATASHARALEKTGILTRGEVEKIDAALQDAQGIEILREHEDCHTALEEFLTARLGDLGKKIHAGRSRNDQVMAALTLWTREHLLRTGGELLSLCDGLNEFARRNELSMPGYTHMQRAMPSSVPLLFGSYLESLLEDLELLHGAFRVINRNPLGSAAGYGTSLGLDRELTAEELAFEGVRNCILVQARPRLMAVALMPLTFIMKTLERMASDLLLFTMEEFGFFSLPDGLTTGSSIMPQKKNYDILELVRARSALVHGYAHEVDMLGIRLTSGYHRDFQLTKRPVLEAFAETMNCLAMMRLIVSELSADPDAMRKALTPELFAADRACELVKQGVPFREAYRSVAAGLDELSVPGSIIPERCHLQFRDYRGEIDRYRKLHEALGEGKKSPSR